MTTIIKVPFDKCIVEKERRGAAAGPEQVEKELKNFFKFEENSKSVKFLTVKELSDFEKMHREVESLAGKEYGKKNFVIGLGGDHSVSYGLMKAFSKKFPKNAGLIYFDAHFDCQDDFLPPTHEDVLRSAVNEKLFKKIFVIGVRNYTKKEKDFVVKNKISWNLADMFYASNAPAAVLDYLSDFVKDIDNIYISIDIDAIDPAFAPGTGWPEPAGILPQHFLYLLNFLQSTKKIRGLDIVEVSPKFDINNITSRLAAKILLEFL